jgi:hypothetical protein
MLAADSFTFTFSTVAADATAGSHAHITLAGKWITPRKRSPGE